MEEESVQAYSLTDMEIDEISLVDKGANPDAHITFFKRKGDTQMDENDIEKRLAELEQENAFYKGMANLSDAEKAYMDKMDDDAKKAFMSMTSDERAKTMKKGDMKKMDNATIEKQLQDIEKRLAEKDDVIKSLQEGNDALSEQVTKMAEENETLKLQKRAETEFAGLSGTVEQKAKLLKALEGIEDEDVRKMAFENVKAKASANEALMTEVGKSGSDESDASTKLQKMAEKYAQEKNITVQKAYSEVITTPEGTKLYKESKKGN